MDTPARSNDLKTANTIDEIRKNYGLPTGIRTEAQLWDEILKKEVYKEPALMLPLIREVFWRELSRWNADYTDCYGIFRRSARFKNNIFHSF